MYKLLALDMDGTLLNKDHNISNENCDAIRKAIEMGVKVVLTSGRPLSGLQDHLNKLNLTTEEDYVISLNGSIIQNAKSKEVLYKNRLSLEEVKYIYNLSTEMGIAIHAITMDKCITPKWNKYAEFEAKLNNLEVELVDFDKLDSNTEIIKLMLSEEKEILDKIIPKLPQKLYNEFSISKSAPFYIDVLPNKVSKGYAIEALAKKLGIEKNEIICMGDAGNDEHMIKYAGLGVAMGNADDELKEVANYITKSNDEHGVAHVIDKFILLNQSLSA